MSELRIVIDQSTSATKALLFNTSEDIQLLDRKDLKHSQIYPQEGWVEHDPFEILNNLKQVIYQLLAENGLTSDNIRSLSLTNQRESILLWDKRTGKPYSNVYVWQCNRGVEICKRLVEEGYSERVKAKTGLRIDPYFSGAKLKWFFDNHRLTEEEYEHLAIGTIDTWLIWNLTDKKTFVTDISNASRTLLFDIFRKQWDEELCQIFNVPLNALPLVVDSIYDFGSYEGIPIVSVIADSQAALFGHGRKNHGDVKATLGTGSSVMMNIGADTFNEDNTILTTVAWELNGQPTYALEGIIKSYSDNLNWLEDGLGLVDDISASSNKAFNLKDVGSVRYIPALEGLGAPFWVPEAQAIFKGMTRDTTKFHLLRAVFEAMVFQTRAVIEEMEVVSGITIDSIYVDGGPVKNQNFMQLLSDATEKQIVVGQFEEASAVGALNVYLQKEIGETARATYIPQNNYQVKYNLWRKSIEDYLKELRN